MISRLLMEGVGLVVCIFLGTILGTMVAHYIDRYGGRDDKS